MDADRDLQREWDGRLDREGLGMGRGKIRRRTAVIAAERLASGGDETECAPPLALRRNLDRLRSVAELARILLPDARGRAGCQRMLRMLHAAEKVCGVKLLTKFGSGRNSKQFATLRAIRKYVPHFAGPSGEYLEEFEALRARVQVLERKQRATAAMVRKLRSELQSASGQ